MKSSRSKFAGQRGLVAVIVVVTMLSVLVVYALANVRALVHVHNELKLLEQRQQQTLRSRTAPTNAPSQTPPVAGAPTESH